MMLSSGIFLQGQGDYHRVCCVISWIENVAFSKMGEPGLQINLINQIQFFGLFLVLNQLKDERLILFRFNFYQIKMNINQFNQIIKTLAATAVFVISFLHQKKQFSESHFRQEKIALTCTIRRGYVICYTNFIST